MIKTLRRLTTVLSVFAYSLLSAQGTCSYSESASGPDNVTAVEFDDFDCVDTVTNSFITLAELNVGTIGSWCPNWYLFDIEVNGAIIAEDLCSLPTTDLSTYNVDVNNITSLKVISKNAPGDLVGDNVNINATLDLTYIVTTCPPPSGVTASNINPTTADITWSSNGSELIWNMEVVNLTAGDSAVGVATYSGITANPYGLTGLLPETNYAIYVQSDCGPFNTEPLSDWSFAGTFTTPPTCLPLGAISIDSISDTTVDLSWGQVGSETSWDIELINVSNIPADTFTFTPNNAGLSTNAPFLTGLDPESDYEFIVRANCGLIDGPGAWSTVYSFTTLPTCQAPIDLLLGGYTNDEITFSWTAIDTETMWYVEYINVTVGEVQTGIADDSTTTDSYTAINLDANSEYQLFVSAACGGADGNSYWSGPVTIATLCNPVAMPLTEPFSTWVPDCFDVDNGDTPWQVHVSGGDTIAAKARNTWPNYGTNRHLMTPMIDMDQAALLTFKWSHLESTWMPDTLSVKLSSDGGSTWSTIWSVTGSAFDSNDGVNWSTPGSYVTEYLLIDNSYVGTDVIVDIAYTSPNSSGNTVFIDSLAVTALPPCNIPYDLAVDSVYTTSVDMSFTLAGTGATIYEIEIIEPLDTLTGVATNTASGSPFTVAGLNPGTDYLAYVRTMCGTDSTVWVGPIPFTTICAPVIDYATSFEGLATDDPINCWNLIDSTNSSWSDVEAYYSTWTVGNTGFSSLHFTSSNSFGVGHHQYAVMPEFSNISALTHRLRFFARNNSGDNNEIVIGTMSDPTDINTFTPKDTILPTTVYTQYTFNFDDYSGSDNYIALRHIPYANYQDVFADDFEWHEIPNCFPPTTVTIDSTSTTSISVSVDSAGTFGTEWFIEMVDVSGNNPTVIDTAYAPSFTVDGLMSSTVYEMTISTNCPDAISEGTSMTVQTDCAPIGDFYNNFEDLDGGADTTICWDYTVVDNLGSQWSFPTINVYNSTWNTCDGSKAVRMYSGDDPNAELLLVTPELTDINAGTHVLTFTATNFSSWAPPSPYEVGTITDGDDASTFTALYSGVAGQACDSVIVPFLSYTGTDTRIAIRFDFTSTYDNLYIDKVRWEEGPDCAMPVGFDAIEVLDSETTLDWLNVSPDTVWHIELVDVLDTLDVYDSIPTDTAYAHPYTLTGLTENTIYEAYLTNPCDTVYNASMITFITPWGNNLALDAIISPVVEGCNTSDSSQIEIQIENLGGLAATGFPVELSWDDSIYFNAGTFNDTILPGAFATFILDGYYDFSTSIDSAFYVRTALVGDSVTSNDMLGSTVTNLGTMWIELELNTGGSGYQVGWEIVDTLNNYTVAAGGDINGSGNLWTNTTYNYDVCIYPNIGYTMNSYDEGGTGWQGGTYALYRCGGILIANNDGNAVDNGVDSSAWNIWELEAQEVFVVEECPDNDLAVLSIDSLETSCGLGTESGYVLIKNFGNLDVAANGATAQYQFNNSGLWIDFWDFDSGLASQTDTLYQLPDIDMSIAGAYTIAVKVVFALDQDLTSNEFEFELNSLPTLTQDSAAFETGTGHWYSVIQQGTENSWERGIPTTTNIGNNNDGKVWATNLTGNAALNEYSYLYSPCYDFSNYTEPAEISFDYIRPGNLHYYLFSRSFDGGDTWYNWSPWSAFPQSNTNDWTNVTLLMQNAPGQSSCIFRWRYSAYSWQGPGEGLGFDNWEVKEHVEYDVSSLSDLEVNNNTVSAPVAFDPAVFDYTYEVPYGSTNYNVTATATGPIITSMTIDQAGTLPDTAFVTVVAENDSISSVYTVYITEGPAATDATLSSFSVSNNSVPGFDPDTLCYEITYPYGSAFTPSISAVANDPNATVVITNVQIPGTATVVVTAEDGITVNTYCVNYEVETLSTNALMADILMDGSSLTGFVANTYWYYVTLPNGTTSLPLMAYTTADANATVNYTPATLPLTDTAIFEVTAQDGITMVTYYVVFDEAPSDNANLLDLTINGGTVSGFDATVLIYNIELPFNSPIPNLDAMLEDTTATVVIDHAIVVPGTTIITVTAADGTVSVYYVNWSYAAANDDATLDSLMTNAGYYCMISGSDTLAAMEIGDVDENEYNLTVGTGFTSLVNLTIIPNDPNATYTLSGSATVAPYGTIIITVTAEDGSTQAIYTVNVIAEDCSVGLDEMLLGQINVSPNPSNGIFFIETPADLNDYTISVVDQLGKVVYEEVAVEASMEKVIDLSTLPAGMYNMRINTANDFIVKRVSIIK